VIPTKKVPLRAGGDRSGTVAAQSYTYKAGGSCRLVNTSSMDVNPQYYYSYMVSPQTGLYAYCPLQVESATAVTRLEIDLASGQSFSQGCYLFVGSSSYQGTINANSVFWTNPVIGGSAHTVGTIYCYMNAGNEVTQIIITH